jgi:hypothetical protein
VGDECAHETSCLDDDVRAVRSGDSADEDRLEVLAGPPACPAVHVALEPLSEPKTSAAQDLRVQTSSIVHDDTDGRSRREPPARVRQHVRDAVDVRLDGSAPDAAAGTAELVRPPLVEAEQLVGVAVLLVVVDQPGVRRRGDDGVERPAER